MGRYAKIHTVNDGNSEKILNDPSDPTGSYYVIDLREAFSTYQNGGEIIKYNITNGDCVEKGRANSYWVIYGVTQTALTDVSQDSVYINGRPIDYTLGTGVRKNAFCKKENKLFESMNQRTVDGVQEEIMYTLITLGGLCTTSTGGRGKITNITPVTLTEAFADTTNGFYHEFIEIPYTIDTWMATRQAGIVIS